MQTVISRLYPNNLYSNYSFTANKILPVKLPVQHNISDLKQHGQGELSEYLCGPVSTANGIIELSKKGFANLYKTNDSKALINELTSYFKTDKNGTTTKNMCDGLEAFVRAKGYTPEIKYQGFREINPKYKNSLVPDLKWIKDEIDKQNMVLLNLGVYKKANINGKNIYQRQYGHFVLATGKNSNGITPDANYLTIYDPYDKVQGPHYIKTSKINQGKLMHNADDNEVSLTDNASGFLEVPTKFNYFAPDEVAVINGALSLGVKK